jgi:UDP-N-acetylmuramoyl-tripeptide--D-alanyl-D-alanine ligase
LTEDAVALQALTLQDVVTATRGKLVLPEGAAPARGPISGVSIDSRTIRPRQVFFAIVGPTFDGHDFVAEAKAKGASAAVVQRDLPARELPVVRVADTTHALGDLARERRRSADLEVVAITGSTGKTTTKDMTAALVEARGPVLKTEGNLNNQYGLPLTLLRLGAEHKTAVLEMGMSAAREIRHLTRIAEPDLAVITNVGHAHLGFFSSPDEIASAKAEILEGLRPGGRAVLNGDDWRVRRIGREWGGRVVWFGRDRRHEVSAENWRGTLFGMRFDLVIGDAKLDVALPLPGVHSLMDFLAAAAVAHALGVEPAAMAEVALHMVAGKHRGEVLRLRDGIMLLDDSYNSSPEALNAALATLGMAAGGRRVAVLGDMLELGERGPEIHRERGLDLLGRLDLLAAVGELGREIAQGACRAGLPAGAVHLFPDAAAAAAAVPGLLQAGDAVLVKASRGMRLEAVVAAIVARFGEGEA